MKSMIVMSLLLVGMAANADNSVETWSVEGKTFEVKAQAVRYVMSLGKPVSIEHTRCEILTNKLSFKACPKAAKTKAKQFENEQYTGLKVSE